MKKNFPSKNNHQGDALITTLVSLAIVTVFILGFLNIAAKRTNSYANYKKYVDIKISMSNALHSALNIVIKNYDNLDTVATRLDNLDSDEGLKAIFNDIAKRYSFLNESSPTIFSDVKYLESVSQNVRDKTFKTAYGYPSVYYLKMGEAYEDVIISTVKKDNDRIINYLVGIVEKQPFFDELRKKVYITNDSEADPNKKSRFLPEEEFSGGIMAKGNLFFNDFKGKHGNANLDEYGIIYFPISYINNPSEIPTSVFFETLSDFNRTIVASSSEFLWVGEGNNSTSTMTAADIETLFATNSTYKRVNYDWEYLGNDLSAETKNFEDFFEENATDTSYNSEIGLKFSGDEFSMSSKMENGYTVVTIEETSEKGKNKGKKGSNGEYYKIKIEKLTFPAEAEYFASATVEKYEDDSSIPIKRLKLKKFNGKLYFDNDLVIGGASTNYSNVDLKIMTSGSIKFEQNFFVYGLTDVSSATVLSLNDPILNFVAGKSIKFQKRGNGNSDETYKIAGSLYALEGALAFVGNGNGELNLYVFGQVIEGHTIEHIGQGFGSGVKKDIPGISPNEYVGGGGSFKNNIMRHFYYDPRLWFVDYYVPENIKRIFVPRYKVIGITNVIEGTFGSVIVKLNYMGW